MFKPSSVDFDLLFNGNEEKLKQFNEQYFEIIEEFSLKDIFNKFKEYPIKDQIKVAFISIFGVDVYKDESKDKILRKFSGALSYDNLDEVFENYENVPSSDGGYPIVTRINDMIKNYFEIREFKFNFKKDHKNFFVLDNNTWNDLIQRYGGKVSGFFETI